MSGMETLQKAGRGHDWRLMKRMWPFMRPHRHLVMLSLLLLPLTALVQVAQPIVIMRAVDSVLAEKSLAALHRYVFLYAGLLAAHFLLQRWQLLTLQATGIRIVRDMRMALFRHLQGLSMSYFTRTPVGRLMTRLTNDVENLNETFSSGLVAIIGDLFLLAGIAAAMFTLNWRMALTAFAVVPPLLLLASYFRRRLQEIFRRIRNLAAHVNTYLQENIAGMSVVQAFVREDENYAEFSRRNEEYRRENLRSVFFDSWFSASVQAATTIATACILWYTGFGILGGTLTLGMFLAFYDYIHKFFDPIEDLAAKYTILQSGLSSAEKIFGLLDEGERLPAAECPVRAHRFRGEVELENLGFAYSPEGPEVLKDIHLRVRPGETVAFVGHTGAGKTTLIKLVNRLYDATRGALRIDGINVRDFELDLLRRRIGVVLQDVFIFQGTVRENITLGEDMPPEKVEAAARAVGADRFIARMPGGYEAQISERGANLSTGQRQLLAFARVLAMDPAILIMDEATASIDSESEALIQEALPRLLAGRTALIVAHRLSTVRRAGRIVVMHHGEIKETGTHEELLARRGIYWRLYQLQFRENGENKGVA